MIETSVRRDIMERLTRAGEGGVLRFITCGSVDDGKSTLIGRLLYDSKLLLEDQIAILERDSRRHGTASDGIDFALLLDGLEAEREQGITIDVAYRFFNTEKRKFIVADTPGHEQYTRNMATGASTADLAIILVDVRKGVLTQTRRHTYIANMMGIRHAVLAVNKMDLASYSPAHFHRIVSDYLQIAEHLGFSTITPIPISAQFGDNIFQRSQAMSWYNGPTLMEHLENVDNSTEKKIAFAFRFPVQWVNRPNLDFRGFSGSIAAGSIAREQIVPVSVTSLKHKLNVNTFDKEPGTALKLNEIGVCTLSTARPIAFDVYDDQRETGSFILIDRFSNQTVGAGMIEFSLRRASNIHTHAMDMDKTQRAELKGQKPAVLWFTGLSGAGKSTVANLVERKLVEAGRHTYSLDGDNVRHGLNRDLGFTDADRVENIRRIGEVAKLMADAGLIVTCSFISPFRSERQMVRELMEEGEFIEVFVDTPLEVCIKRDPKGLYKKAHAGEIKNFTGFDSPYEAPEAPELHLHTGELSPENAAEQVIQKLIDRGLIG